MDRVAEPFEARIVLELGVVLDHTFDRPSHRPVQSEEMDEVTLMSDAWKAVPLSKDVDGLRDTRIDPDIGHHADAAGLERLPSAFSASFLMSFSVSFVFAPSMKLTMSLKFLWCALVPNRKSCNAIARPTVKSLSVSRRCISVGVMLFRSVLMSKMLSMMMVRFSILCFSFHARRPSFVCFSSLLPRCGELCTVGNAWRSLSTASPRRVVTYVPCTDKTIACVCIPIPLQVWPLPVSPSNSSIFLL